MKVPRSNIQSTITIRQQIWERGTLIHKQEHQRRRRFLRILEEGMSFVQDVMDTTLIMREKKTVMSINMMTGTEVVILLLLQGTSVVQHVDSNFSERVSEDAEVKDSNRGIIKCDLLFC